MNLKDIQNALDRIISFNKNLDEQGLRTLLIASGWDTSKIEEAITFFKTYSPSESKVASTQASRQTKNEKIENLLNQTSQEVVGEVFLDSGEVPPDHLLAQGAETKAVASKEVSQKVSAPRIESNHDTMQSVASIKDTEQTSVAPSHEVIPHEDITLPLVQTPSVQRETPAQETIILDIPEKKEEMSQVTKDEPKKEEVAPTLDPKKEAIKKVLNGETVIPQAHTTISSAPVVAQLKQEAHILSERVIPESTPTTQPLVSIEIPVEKVTPEISPQKETVEKIKEPTSRIDEQNNPASPNQQKQTIEKVPVEIPEGLPVRPFDASPHIVSFSEYKESFHGESPAATQETKRTVTAIPQARVTQAPVPPQMYIPKPKKVTPLSKGDRDLVITASVLLLIILLLLGYMYSNGRL